MAAIIRAKITNVIANHQSAKKVITTYIFTKELMAKLVQTIHLIAVNISLIKHNSAVATQLVMRGHAIG
jgi:hypothetical protein